MSKAQIFTTSMIFTVVLFIVILGIGARMWDYLSLTQKDVTRTRELELMVTRVSDLLVSTPGQPYNWTTDVECFGLSTNKPGVLDAGKVKLFYDYSLNNYSFVKERLGIEGYDFSFRLVNGSATLYSYNWTFDYSRDLSKSERIVLLNDTPMIFELVVRQ
ncbi:MAG: hypothetical protein GOU97_04510 [Nanoarchaeota archaeon]|nr:hypothetical protein [Nanoarchaeota archaeon]